MNRKPLPPEIEKFKLDYREFVQSEIVPNDEAWRKSGIVDRTLFKKAASAGFLGFAIPKEYGGGGLRDFRYNQIIAEGSELWGVGPSGSGLLIHNDMVMPYMLHYCTDEQKGRWFKGMCSGDFIGAIAITEPMAGSDMSGIQTTATRHKDKFVVNGTKTLIGNGINSDIVIVVARAPNTIRHDGISLLVLERGMGGFSRGRNLPKVGRKAQDTGELIFENVEVPAKNLLGKEGGGFGQLVQNLPLERMDISISAIAASTYAYQLALKHVKERKAFGKPIGHFQNTRFKMAEMATEIQMGQVFVDRAIEELNAGSLTAEVAAMAKWWSTELLKRVTDTALQLHGGYGYLEEFPISRAWQDGRITSIYGGTTEIMKEIVGRSLGI